MWKNKMDLTQHNALHHAQRNCIICNAQKYGDNHLNDHTKMCHALCRLKRDKNRAENDKKAKERKEKNPIKPKNMYTLLMDEGSKNEENEREQLSLKEAKKDIKRTERENKKIKEGIPEGVPKIIEIYTNVDKDDKIKTQKQREEGKGTLPKGKGRLLNHKTTNRNFTGKGT